MNRAEIPVPDGLLPGRARVTTRRDALIAPARFLAGRSGLVAAREAGLSRVVTLKLQRIILEQNNFVNQVL